MKLPVTTLILSTFLFGCAPSWKKVNNSYQEQTATNTYICIDPFKEETNKSITEAVKLWDKALGWNWKHLIPVNAQTGCEFYIHETQEPYFKDPNALAWTDRVGGTRVFLRTAAIPDKAITGVVLHELGHIFGAQHLDSTLMEPHYHGLAMMCPDRLTVAQVAAWNHLNLETLSWCQF